MGHHYLAHPSCADARPLQGADTWEHGSLTDPDTWQTLSCSNHTELRVGLSYQFHPFTQCEEVCERGGGTLLRPTQNITYCLGEEAVQLDNWVARQMPLDLAFFVGLYKANHNSEFCCSTLPPASYCTPHASNLFGW